VRLPGEQRHEETPAPIIVGEDPVLPWPNLVGWIPAKVVGIEAEPRVWFEPIEDEL